MPLNFIKTCISGLTVVVSHQYNDGVFLLNKYFQISAFDTAGLSSDFRECNIIRYKKGTLRGLHFQKEPSQDKLIYVIKGSVFLVALDLRKKSDTFGKFESFTLSEDQAQGIYIPGLFAVGILALEDDSIVSFNCTGDYIPANCGGIIWNDSTLDIPWPIEKTSGYLTVSEKDRQLLTFSKCKDTYI